VDLIHPATIGEVTSALRAATADRRRVRIVGGRTHAGRAAPREVDAELWTTQLDRTVAYDPAEMIAVVEAGMRVGELQRVLHEGGQEWPVDAPADATVGGVVAAGVSGLRRLRVGHVRDTVVELELVTGDGRLVRSGARTVKNVTGFDIHRLATGSCGALGAIVRIAIKVRPVPQAVRTMVQTGDGGLDLGRELLRAVPAAAAVLAGPDRIEVRLEGWAAEVDELAGAARSVAGDLYALEGDGFPSRPVDGAPLVVEAAVPPSRMDDLVRGSDGWIASIGVGLVWFGLEDGDDATVRAIHDRAVAAGGMARPIRGSVAAGTLPDTPLPAADVQARLRSAFDPAGVLS
jgi:glycolate oxidase FAD binding subunit